MRRIKKWTYGLITLCVACFTFGAVTLFKTADSNAVRGKAMTGDESIYGENEFGDIDVDDIGDDVVHVYDRQVATEEFMKNPATCVMPARYYYSCVCGEKGTATFTYGELGECSDDDKDHVCDVCGAVLSACTDTNGDLICDYCGEEIELTLNFRAANLSLKNTIYIQYAVDTAGLTEEQIENLRVLIWKTPQSNYVYGTHDVELVSSMTATIDYKPYPVFVYTGLVMKEMADDVYACVYLPGGEGRYSEPLRYSVMEYAYAKLGKTGRKPGDNKLQAVCVDLLELGASMQIYTNHKVEERLATDTYTYVNIANAVFDDGVSTGLYKPGTVLNITAKPDYVLAETYPDYITVNGDEITLTVPDTLTIDTTSFVFLAHGNSPITDEAAEVVVSTPQHYENSEDYAQKAVENVNENYVAVTMQHTSSEYYGLNINMTGSSTGWDGGVIFSHTQDGSQLRISSAGESGLALARLDIPTDFAENKEGTFVYKWTELMDGELFIGMKLDMWYGIDGVYTKVAMQEALNDNKKWRYDAETQSFIFNYNIVPAEQLAPDCTIISLSAQNACQGADCDWTITKIIVYAFDEVNKEFVGNDDTINWDDDQSN